jgi:hypothetical protein
VAFDSINRDHVITVDAEDVAKVGITGRTATFGVWRLWEVGKKVIGRWAIKTKNHLQNELKPCVKND